ncbi:hypothetical protein A8H37_07880 [Burkholderia thailandensis]|nr:hypothetical protein A8H37_07880 [Burkholderia thailandensis]
MNAITRPAGSHTARPVSSDAAALDATPARSPLAQRTRAPDDPARGKYSACRRLFAERHAAAAPRRAMTR